MSFKKVVQYIKVNKYNRYSNARLSQDYRDLMKLVQRYGLICWYCGIPLDESNIIREHIITRSKGGKDILENWALSCDICNRAKNDIPVGRLLKWFEHIRSKNFSSPIRYSVEKIIRREAEEALRKALKGSTLPSD